MYHIINTLDIRNILKDPSMPDSDDVLDELLNLTIDWSKSNSTSLQGFIYWIEKRDIQIKRDISSKNQVRVMTIHASKGLEAPIVILPDTTSLPNIGNHFLWENGDFLWTNSNNNSNKAYSNSKQNKQNLDYQEYLRLLYVAITRAEDHLIIAGYKIGSKKIDNSWYDIASKAKEKTHHPGLRATIQEGMTQIQDQIEDHKVIKPEIIQEEKPRHPGPRAGIQEGMTQIQGQIEGDKVIKPKVTKENTEVRYVRSPLDKRTDISYGIVLHKILEDIVNAKNPALVRNHPYLQFIPEISRNSILRKIPRLFESKEFTQILAFPNIKTEASIGYRNESGNIKFGRMDLLAISNNEAIIIDYKTDKNPPSKPSEVNPKYKEQLSNYVNFIKKTHPNYQISAKILWFENITLMDILTI